MLVFEEGEEEYDFSTYPHKNVYLEVLDQQTVTTKELSALVKKHRPERVVAELNGMQQVGDLYSRFPKDWVLAQEVMFADSTTIMTYNANMRNLVMDKLTGAQMVVFNRLTKGQDIMPFHKLARAASRQIDILYDYTDGSTEFDEIEDPLPFDINADVIAIGDDDYALWFRDVTEDPEKYDGKTVEFKAQVGYAPPGQERHVCTGAFCHDLLCGRYPVLRSSLQMEGCQGAEAQKLGHPAGEGQRRAPLPVPGRSGAGAYRYQRDTCGACGGGSLHLLIPKHAGR